VNIGGTLDTNITVNLPGLAKEDEFVVQGTSSSETTEDLSDEDSNDDVTEDSNIDLGGDNDGSKDSDSDSSEVVNTSDESDTSEDTESTSDDTASDESESSEDSSPEPEQETTEDTTDTEETSETQETTSETEAGTEEGPEDTRKGFNYNVLQEGRPRKYEKVYKSGEYKTTVVVMEGRVVVGTYDDTGPKFNNASILHGGQKTSSTATLE